MGALIYDYTVPTTTTSINLSIPNLNIQKGELYELTATYTTTSASYTNYNLFINNNTTESNYVFQYLNAGGSSPYTGRVSYAGIFGTSGNTTGQSHSYLKITNNGYYVWQSEFSTKVGSSTLEVANHFGTSTFTVSSITALTLTAKATDGIAAGTRIQLRKVGEKVYDYEVPTATNRVDITDLNIKKDDEYILISDYFNDGTGRSHTLYANDNITATNYWTQYLYGYSTTLGSARENKSITVSGTTNSRSLGITKIKLTNTGHVTWQTNTARTYGTSSIEVGQAYGTSTFQTTAIKKLSLMPTELHQIGAGTRFELYKLYEEPVVEPDPDTYELLAEHIVYSPTTQIDIPVNITKDDEVRLVYTFTAASNNSLYLYANGNTTASNYYSQRLIGTGTSLIAVRVNTPIFGNNATRVSGYIDIKVSNNDKFVAQVYDVDGIGSNSSGIANRNANIVGSGFTATSITSLTVFSTVTNNIAVGSKIRVYKVN